MSTVQTLISLSLSDGEDYFLL